MIEKLDQIVTSDAFSYAIIGIGIFYIILTVFAVIVMIFIFKRVFKMFKNR